MLRPARALAALTLVAALALVGCADASPEPSPSEGPYPTEFTAPPPTPVGEPEPESVDVESTLPAEIAGVDTTGWQQVSPPEGTTATFRIPADWSTSAIPNGLAVLRADGQQQLQLTVVPAAEAPQSDGRCTDATGTAVAWSTSQLDVQPVSIAGAADVAYGAAALQLGGAWIVGVGLLPAGAAQSPSCPIVHGFQADDQYVSFGSEATVQGAGAGSAWAVGSLEDAQAYMGTSEYPVIRAVLMSFEIVG